MMPRLISILTVVTFCLLIGSATGYGQTLSPQETQPNLEGTEQISSDLEGETPQSDPGNVVLLRQLPSPGGSVPSIAKCCNECIETIAASKVKLKCSRCVDVPASGKCDSADKVERFIIDCKGTFLDQKSNFTCYT